MSALVADDFVWLKVVTPSDNYVSTGMLLLQGAPDKAGILLRSEEVLSRFAKFSSLPARKNFGLSFSWSPYKGDIKDQVSFIEVRGEVSSENGELKFQKELKSKVAELVDANLPSDRPLWQIVIITGISFYGKPGYIFLLKTHHAIADGLVYYEILSKIFQVENVRTPLALKRGNQRRLHLWSKCAYLLGLLLPENSSSLKAQLRGKLICVASVSLPTAGVAAEAKKIKSTRNSLYLSCFVSAIADTAHRLERSIPQRMRIILPVNLHQNAIDADSLENRLGYFHITVGLNSDIFKRANDIDAQVKHLTEIGAGEMMNAIIGAIAHCPDWINRLCYRFFASRATTLTSSFAFPKSKMRLFDSFAENIGAFPVIAPPMNFSSMLVEYAGGVTLYLRHNGGDEYFMSQVIQSFSRIVSNIQRGNLE